MENLTIVEYQTQRVLTTEQLAQAYECSADQIKVNFTRNKKRFEEGKHYFKLEGYELKEFKSNYLADCNSVDNKVTKSNPVENKAENFEVVGKNAKSLYLWTKRGASRHCKMLGTDKAWEMFDILEENYFNPKPAVAAPAAAPYVLIPKFFRGKQVITVKDAAAILNTSRSLIESIINKPTGNIHEGKDYYRLKGDKRAEFKAENPSVPAAVHHIIAILESGFKKICEYMLVETPPIFRVENLETKLELDFYCYKYKLEPMTEVEEMICSYANARRVLFLLKKVYEGDKKIEEECNDLLALLLLLINEKNFYRAPVGAMIKNERLSEAKAV